MGWIFVNFWGIQGGKWFRWSNFANFNGSLFVFVSSNLSHLGDPDHYPSSHNHGSEKWFPPIVLTFRIEPFSTSMIIRRKSKLVRLVALFFLAWIQLVGLFSKRPKSGWMRSRFYQPPWRKNRIIRTIPFYSNEKKSSFTAFLESDMSEAFIDDARWPLWKHQPSLRQCEVRGVWVSLVKFSEDRWAVFFGAALNIEMSPFLEPTWPLFWLKRALFWRVDLQK